MKNKQIDTNEMITHFVQWQKQHPNSVTPNLLKVEQIGNSFIEFSWGLGFSQKKIYAVSKIDYKNNDFENDRKNGVNKLFVSKRLAENYILQLKKHLYFDR